MNRGSLAFLCVARIAAIFLAATAGAQETPSTFEFSFSNPGARSLGLAGAFVALADDATTAFANPAGLVQLVVPEVSVDVRHWSYSTPFTEGGRYQGAPTGIGLDTDAGLRTAFSNEHLTDLSFLSVVYPKGRGSLAVYRHQLASFRSRTETQGLFHIGATVFEDVRSLDRRWRTDLEIVGWGIAVAYRISDRLSLGLGLTRFEGRLGAAFEWYLPDDSSVPSIFGLNSYLPERQIARGSMALDGSDWGLNAGLLWGFTEGWSLGAFYRQGPEFSVMVTNRVGPSGPLLLPFLAPGDTFFTLVTPMRFPDVHGMSIAYRSPDARTSLGLEIDRVGYSRIFDSLAPRVVETRDENLDLGIELSADDGYELRLGGEYAFLDLQPVLAIRAGVWLDPDHRFRSISSDPEHRALFRPGRDEIHVAVGVGVAFRTVQIDLAADFSDLVDTASLSLIYAFP